MIAGAHAILYSRDAERDRAFLRDVLGLTGAKYGCGEGRCGSCTVLVDGMAVRSCVVRVEAVVDREIVTIEATDYP